MCTVCFTAEVSCRQRKGRVRSVSFLLQRRNKSWWAVNFQLDAGTGSQHGNKPKYCTVRSASVLNYSIMWRKLLLHGFRSEGSSEQEK